VSLLAALRLLEDLVPCESGEAAAALLGGGLSDAVIHPGGVLSLARWYGVPTELRLVARGGGTAVVGPRPADLSADFHRVLTAVGRAGYTELTPITGATAGARRRLDTALAQDARVRCDGGLVVRVDDRVSGLARHVVRMVVAAPRPLMLAELHEGLQRNWRYKAPPHPGDGDADRVERCSAVAAVGHRGRQVPGR
jgi:hypothetical protein